MEKNISRELKMLGMFLFLLGLITGLILTALKNPRMGLSAHLEGVMNGTFLVVAGLVWNDLKTSLLLKKILFWALVYGSFVNWLMTLLAAIFGTSKLTPIIGAGNTGTSFQENIVSAGLYSVALTMVFALVVLVTGLRRLK